jgi:hypothetical protein
VRLEVLLHLHLLNSSALRLLADGWQTLAG